MMFKFRIFGRAKRRDTAVGFDDLPVEDRALAIVQCELVRALQELVARGEWTLQHELLTTEEIEQLHAALNLSYDALEGVAREVMA